MNSIYLLFALLCFPLCLAQDETAAVSCSDKSLLTGDALTNNAIDWTRAYNDVASCATLKTNSNNILCCYMKIKFDNDFYDETYTQKGCIEVRVNETVDINDDDRFDTFLENKESQIAKASNVEIDSLDIDCGAKFINIFTLSLLLFLL